jgi:hypothetical protein
MFRRDARPATAPEASGPCTSFEDESVVELRRRAEVAHRELASKTKELERLEAALVESSARATRSVSDMVTKEAAAERCHSVAPAALQQVEARGVIERHLRRIRVLEGD